MGELIPVLGTWFWWVVAGILMMLELMAPGVFFIWLAIAAVFTGLVDMQTPMGWQAELLIFAATSIVSVFAGRALLARRGSSGDSQFLNRRQQRFVGHSYVLQQAIVSGRGKLTIEDTTWDIQGPDLPAGSRVKVTDVDGPTLIVQGA
jgi:membrane protein implicated in regulation of membrane protease activity